MPASPPRAWAEIDLDALRHNYQFAQLTSGGLSMMAVVKANGYGHGINNLITALQPFSPEFYGVANVFEAREIRNRLPKARIYLLGAANHTEYEEIVDSDYTPCASSISELRLYAALAEQYNKVFKIHIAIDTGMGRGGFLPDTPELKAGLAYTSPYLEIEGLGSHLPVADEDEAFTKEQFQRFEAIADERFRYRHLANSAGLLHYRSNTLNLVRPGLALYGVSPLPQYQSHLQPVMRLCSRISLIRKIPAGCSVSYGRTFITARDSRIATVGIGYADGIPRAISGKSVHVWVDGALAPIVGRVTMDQIMVDLTDLPKVKEGAVVEIFGPNLSVTKLADAAKTIPWEIFTSIAPRVDRVTMIK